MNEDTITDLKQFITATVSQQTSDLDEKIDKLDYKLSQKIDDLSAAAGEVINSTHEVVDTQLQGHEKRIKRLERKTT